MKKKSTNTLEMWSNNPNYPAWIKIQLYEKFEGFTVVKMLFVAFWFVISCGFVGGYRHFEGTYLNFKVDVEMTHPSKTLVTTYKTTLTT
jgi:hypothetical protein